MLNTLTLKREPRTTFLYSIIYRLFIVFISAAKTDIDFFLLKHDAVALATPQRVILSKI